MYSGTVPGRVCALHSLTSLLRNPHTHTHTLLSLSLSPLPREDRDISGKATPLLERAVSTVRMAASDGLQLSIVEVQRCEGVATVIYSRGRARPGYEYNLSARWELVNTVDATLAASGGVELYDIADSDSDVFSRMKVGVGYAAPGVDKTRSEKVVRDAADDLRLAIRTWAEMLKKM